MFKKEKCPNCKNKISKNHDFCPSCGKKVKQTSEEDWGMLGKTDMPEQQFPGIKLPFGVQGIFNMLTKTLAKEMQSLDQEFSNQTRKEETKQNQPKVKSNSFSINISTAGGQPPKIQIKQFGKPIKQIEQNKMPEEKPREKISLPFFGKSQQQKFAELETLEPETNVRRLADSMIYEIKLPKVKSEKEISITKLQKTIEVKAISRTKSYFKSLQIPFPIIGYEFDKEILSLELEARD
jgi:hypothetical protein